MDLDVSEKDFEVELDSPDEFHVFTVDFEVEGDYYDLDSTEDYEGNTSYFYELDWKSIKFIELNVRDKEEPDYKVTEADIAYIKDKIIDYILERYEYYNVDECDVAECE